ncbi:helix-turn-helix transcriptional regulator [Mycobacterium sp. ACS4331]|uniref:helix-turn-helix domain-containing protein n=1 Tax=Mycobacterium sp. ACS4331 TaxID=1834121 RepID=UPI000800C691|nr:helix-turn-helix transcriptional regulator [Mycobacterium sp. ACS4331]OBF20031.1 transcriptional regulator [Mycobacterium sp. ACS4331]
MPKGADPLAEFLRTCRGKIQPDDVGLPRGSRRRVSGLRREEVAMLAGISTDYYHRIEQGRERPSDQVLNALARAMRLTPDQAAHMCNLATDNSLVPRPNRQVHPALQDLLDGWTHSPAHIHDVSTTVILTNPLAAALSPSFAPGSSPLRSLFLDPGSREFYRNWNGLTAWAVRWLRSFVGDHPDPRLHALIDQLNTSSERFRTLWAEYDVKGHASGLLLLNHPIAGPLDLYFQHLTLRGTQNTMVVYWAQPGTPSVDGLNRLRDQA